MGISRKGEGRGVFTGAAFFRHVDGMFFAEGDNMPRRDTAATSDMRFTVLFLFLRSVRGFSSLRYFTH